MFRHFYFKQFNLAYHLLALSLNVKHFSLTHRLDHSRCYQFGPEWSRKRWQWMSTWPSLKLQDYWILTIRLSYTGHSLVGVLQRCSRCILQAQLTRLYSWRDWSKVRYQGWRKKLIISVGGRCWVWYQNRNQGSEFHIRQTFWSLGRERRERAEKSEISRLSNHCSARELWKRLWTPCVILWTPACELLLWIPACELLVSSLWTPAALVSSSNF